MPMKPKTLKSRNVTSREGRVSRNIKSNPDIKAGTVTSREGRVSRNPKSIIKKSQPHKVTSREGRVSRNLFAEMQEVGFPRHVPRGTCE